MNEFQSIESGQGILQNDYADSAIAEALKRKREKLKKTKLGEESKEEEDNG